MNHPIISLSNGKARHNEMMQTADNYRRRKQLQLGAQPWRSYLAHFLGFLTARVGKAGSGETAEPLARAS